VSHHVQNLITIPLFTGAIGYLTNWSGVWMLFNPVHFKGFRVPGLAREPSSAQDSADPGRRPRRRRLAGDHPVARREDGLDRRGQGDREAGQAE
jgi:hypothetical protein